MKLLGYFLSISILLSIPTSNTWDFKKEKQGIKVFTRESTIDNLKELKITTSVTAQLNSIVAVLNDVDSYKDWVYKTKEAKILERVNENSVYYYSESEMPWPLSNRDVCVYSTLLQDPVTKTITSTSSSRHTYIENKNGIVRVEVLESKWVFTPLEDGTVDINYQMKTDPGGNIPLWMYNLAIDQGPVQTILGFKKMLNNSRYKNAVVENIEEY